MMTLKLLYTLTIWLSMELIQPPHYEYVEHRCYEIDLISGKWRYVK